MIFQTFIRNMLRINSRYLWRKLINFNSIYSEIAEYNNSFWSKYLLSIWLILGLVIITFLYCVLFSEMNIIIRFIIGYALIVCYYNIFIHYKHRFFSQL